MSRVEDWFGGNSDAEAIYVMLQDLAHIWDDLIDRDNPVSDEAIHRAFRIALIYLPSNKLYRELQDALIPFWVAIVSAYETANKYERGHDDHGIEIAHNLRYAAGHLMAYITEHCVGHERAKEVMPDIWKDIVVERFDAYSKEHAK